MCSTSGLRRGPSRWIAAPLLALMAVAAACSAQSTEDLTTETPVTDLPSPVTETETESDAAVPAARVDTLEGASIRLEEVASADQPVALSARPGSDSIYVAERPGRLRQISARVSYDRDGSVRSTSYSMNRGSVLDISDRVGDVPDDPNAPGSGLLDLTFSNDGRRVYLHFLDDAGDNVVEEHRLEGDRISSDSRREVLRVPGGRPDHPGGGLVFGPDGFLYVGIGAPERAGDETSPRGTVLRIDPDGGNGEAPYSVPAGNPYRDGGGAPETWLGGVLDPGRFAFDRVTGELWVADRRGPAADVLGWLPNVQGLAGRGADLGWAPEPDDTTTSTRAAGAQPASPSSILVDRPEGSCGMVGGVVYRGELLSSLEGAYVFGDRCLPSVWALLAERGQLAEQVELTVGDAGLADITEDTDRELWVASNDGTVWQVAAP